MRRMMVALAVGGAALVGAGAAHAQQPPLSAGAGADDSLFCVYDALVSGEDYMLVAEVFLYDDLPEADMQQAVHVVEMAKKRCAETFKLTEGQVATIGDVGIYASAIDYLSEDLFMGGASEDTIEKVYDVYESLSDDQLDRFFEADWRSDVAFSGQLKGLLVGAGLTDDDDDIDTAFAIMEISAMADEAMWLFELDALAQEPS